MSIGVEPKHKLTSSQKANSNYVDDVVRYYTQQANLFAGDKTKIQVLYDAAQGIIDKDTYKYVLNPYNTKNEKLRRFPSRLRNYDIISPVINLWLGENSRKPKGGTVVATEADSKNKRKKFIADKLKGNMFQDFINHLNEMGMDTGMQQKEIENYQKEADRANSNFDDIHASIAQEGLDYIKYDQDIDDKVQELLYDWVVAGRYCTYRDIYLNDVIFEVCDPRDIYVVGWGKSRYIEDADGVVHVKRMTPNAILDAFQDEIKIHKDKDKIIEWLDGRKSLDGFSNDLIEIQSENIDRKINRESDINQNYDDSYIRVYHVVWKSFKKVGLLTYYDEFGMPQQIEVDDTYKPVKSRGESVEWFWINEVWDAYKFEDKYLIGGRPMPIQRNQLNNLSECKLPYNGRILGYRNSEIISPVQQGINYQILFNILHYRWELLLAKNKDKILALPQSIIPDGDNWETDKFLYWISADGLMMYDDSKPRIAALINGIKAIDMSMGNYMDKMHQLMMQVKEEWWDIIGMNRQRYGDSFASDLKGTTEQAIYRSGMITADMFRQLDKTLEKDYEALLDYSKAAWIDGKKGMYINSDRRRAFLDITAEMMLNYQSTEYGVFVKNTTEEYENLERAKQLLQTMGQNGLDPEHLIGILNATTMSRVKELAKEGMAIEREFQQQQQQAENEANIKAEEMKTSREKAKNETQLQATQIKADADIEVALIGADASLLDILNNTGEMENPQAIEAIDSAIDRFKDRQDAVKLQQANIANQQKTEDNALKRDKMINDLKIARTNRNKYDK